MSKEGKRNLVLLGFATLATVLILAGTIVLGSGTQRVTASDTLDEAQVNKLIGKYIDDNLPDIFDKLNKYVQERQQKTEQVSTEEAFQHPIDPLIRDFNPVRGPKDAVITLVDYSDFECPFCARSRETLHEIMKRYEGKIRWIFKSYPLPFHSHAKEASYAAMAANEQGKFWPYHDELYANQQNLGDKLYLKISKDVGLDIDKFNKDRHSDRIKKMVEQDEADATKVGVRGTPHFLINGVPLSGAQPPAAFEAIIQRHLDAKK